MVECEQLGPVFTFWNGRMGRNRVINRLDRVLCSLSVLGLWPQLLTKVLRFRTSDHREIHIKLSEITIKKNVLLK